VRLTTHARFNRNRRCSFALGSQLTLAGASPKRMGEEPLLTVRFSETWRDVDDAVKRHLSQCGHPVLAMHCDQVCRYLKSSEPGKDVTKMCRPRLRTSVQCSWPSTCDVRAATVKYRRVLSFWTRIDRNALQTDCLRGVIVVV
jgi:hypothetical protein